MGGIFEHLGKLLCKHQECNELRGDRVVPWGASPVAKIRQVGYNKPIRENAMAELLAEKWMKGVAITTTCLAVMTAIAAARGQACAVKTQVLTGVESSKWAYYQAKSIKQNLAELQKSIFEVDLFGAENVHQDSLYRQKLAAATEEVARYGVEKEEIRKEAEEAGALNRQIATKGNFFSGSVVFFQIAIMLSSVSALLKKKFPWIIGLCLGAIAFVLLCYGLFLKPLMF